MDVKLSVKARKKNKELQSHVNFLTSILQLTEKSKR